MVMMMMRTRRAASAVVGLAVSVAGVGWSATSVWAGAPGPDPWADAMISFDQGVGGNPSYTDATTTLGAPERFTGEGVFPGVVSPFNPPFGTNEIVSIGAGGTLVVEFDEPVEDDPNNPFGVDLLIFGNAGFIDGSFPSGIVAGVFGDDGGMIEVSEDGTTWLPIPSVAANGIFPTLGYADAAPYDSMPGGIETDFTLPVDPALTVADFMGLDLTGVTGLYDGSGGGAGVDIASTGLASIRFVRITNAPDATTDIEIDALSDVSAAIVGDVTGDGVIDFADILAVIAAWGTCADGSCAADLSGNGDVGFEDILIIIGNWSS